MQARSRTEQLAVHRVHQVTDQRAQSFPEHRANRKRTTETSDMLEVLASAAEAQQKVVYQRPLFVDIQSYNNQVLSKQVLALQSLLPKRTRQVRRNQILDRISALRSVSFHVLLLTRKCELLRFTPYSQVRASTFHFFLVSVSFELSLRACWICAIESPPPPLFPSTRQLLCRTP